MDAATLHPAARPDPLPVVRSVVRDLLVASPAFHALPQRSRVGLAQALVHVCQAAALLVREELHSDAAARAATRSQPTGDRLAVAQSAGSDFSGVAASRVADTTRQVLDAVSFPRFVSELITGVFKALTESSRQQMQSYLELISGVSASIEGFEASALGDDAARSWLADRYPAFEVSGDRNDDTDPEEGSGAVLRLRAGADPPPAEALRVDLGLGPQDTVPTGDPERTLVPLARRALARNRQQMLATMVMLGMQRIVIESGRINAAMRFHIDTRSAAQNDRGNSFELRNKISAGGSFGIGAWGASASVQNDIAYVTTERTQTTEEMNTSVDLNSSVEVVFKSDYLPLNRLASSEQVERIRRNTRNPDAELQSDPSTAAREQRNAQSDAERRRSLDARLAAPAPAPDPAVPAPAPVPATAPAAARPTAPAPTAAPAAPSAAAPRTAGPASGR